jgi:hypothetical protein
MSKPNSITEWMENASPEQLDAYTKLYNVLETGKSPPIRKQPNKIVDAISDVISTEKEDVIFVGTIITILSLIGTGIIFFGVKGSLESKRIYTNFQLTLEKTQECRSNVKDPTKEKLDLICGKLPDWKNFDPEQKNSFQQQFNSVLNCRQYHSDEQKSLDEICGPFPTKETN